MRFCTVNNNNNNSLASQTVNGDSLAPHKKNGKSGLESSFVAIKQSPDYLKI